MSHTPIAMNGKFRLFKGALKIAVTALALSLCLFADSSVLEISGAISSIRFEATAVFRDPGTQWMVFLCLTTNFLTFLILQGRTKGLRFWHATNPSLWLTGLLFLGALVYAFNYSAVAQSTQALMLLAGVVLGSGASMWAGFAVGGQKSEVRNDFGVLLMSLLVILLTLASLSHANMCPNLEYHGHARWSGPWNNPNVFGLLMGVGIVLAIGSAVLNFEFLVFSKSNTGNWKGYRKWWKIVFVVLCLLAVILMGRGLLHSYSRGAWVATLCGASYLGYQVFKCQVSGSSKAETSCSLWLKNNWFPAGVILFSVAVLSFWHFRQTDWHPAHRAFSVANQNDFSWRNRVAAWEGALQIMAEHPMLGAGWNQPEHMYENYYRQVKIDEAAAVQLNDYLMLGSSLGLPALFCFGMYVWLSLTGKAESGDRHDTCPALDFGPRTLDLLQATCRAGAIVLLVGFWFDGGLFGLPTAAVFWILLGLGSVNMGRKALATDGHG